MRDDVIIATGRSDYPNQVNNVLGFPYIFRGALDVRATTINMEMKIAAAQALAKLAQEDVPDEVAAAYQGARPALRARIHHPGAVRPAPDPRRFRLRRAGRHGYRASPASRSSTWTPTARSSRRGAIPSPARCSAPSSACAAIPSASSSPRARRSRSSAPPCPSSAQGLGTADPRRPRGPHHADRGARRPRPRRARRHRDPQRRAVVTATRPMRNTSTTGCSGRAICSATASA